MQGVLINYNLQCFWNLCDFSFIYNSLNPLKLYLQLFYTLSCTVEFDLSSRGVLWEAEGGAAAGASTSGTFSFTGEVGSGLAALALALAGGSSADEVGGMPPPKLWAISSKVLPFVSGTLMKVKMKKKMRKPVKMRKTQGPHHSWGDKRGEFSCYNWVWSLGIYI